MNLSKMQIAAVKQMAKSLKPIETKIDKLQQKRMEIEDEIFKAETAQANIHRAIESFTGGLSLTEVLNPEAVPTQIEEGSSVDAEAQAEETDVTNIFNDAVFTPTEVVTTLNTKENEEKEFVHSEEPVQEELGTFTNGPSI
jgi:DNA-directed RNA polymerase alpha subunit